MIKTAHILQTIHQALATAFPAVPIYPAQLPKEHLRPCFFIAPDTQTLSTRDKYTHLVDRTFAVQYLASAEAEAAEANMAATDEVCRLFAGQTLSVGDRCVSVRGITAKHLEDRAEIAIALQYCNKVSLPPQEDLPMMAKVNINKGVK